MIKDILRSIDSLGTWGTLAIIIFFSVFLTWILFVCFMDKDFRNHMENLPLDGDNTEEEQ